MKAKLLDTRGQQALEALNAQRTVLKHRGAALRDSERAGLREMLDRAIGRRVLRVAWRRGRGAMPGAHGPIAGYETTA